MTDQEFIESIRLEGEEWRGVPELEERYAVSNFGRILSYSAPYKCGNRICRRKQQMLKPRGTNTNPCYLSVVLSDGNGTRRAFVVHRIVASAFVPNPMGHPFVNHKDENSKNNRADNLEWCTQQYNCNYGTHNARMAKTISETAYQRRKVVQLSQDGMFVNQFDSITNASRALNIPRLKISRCCRSANRLCAGFLWMYLSDYETLVGMSKNSQPIPKD